MGIGEQDATFGETIHVGCLCLGVSLAGDAAVDWFCIGVREAADPVIKVIDGD
jgi:hypothetical protein